jgi:ligand-binding sensor domain-containing protein
MSHFRLALTFVLLLFLAVCLGGLIYLFSTYPIFARPSPIHTTITWPTLPTPTISKSQWRSFTAPQTVNAAVLHEGLLWAATEGGVVVWDWQTGEAVHFTTEHGLAENVVTAVTVGLDGALWFGSQSGGISRFDGASWQTFTAADGLPANQIHDLAVTRDGYVWAATDKGVGQYDGRRWYSYTLARSFFQLPGEEIHALAVAPDGLTVWAATDQGTARFNGRRWEAFTQPGTQSINDLRDITITPDGMVWAATPGGLIRFDGRNWEIFTSADGLESEDVWRVSAVPDNTIWLSYADSATLTQFDATSNVPTASTITPAGNNPQVTARSRFGFASLPTGLLFSIAGELHYQDNNGETRLFRLPGNLPGQMISGLAAGADGVWLAGPFGVSRFDGVTWQTYTSTHGLADTAVAALTLNRKGQIAVAFPNAAQGIALYEPAEDNWQLSSCPEAGPASPLIRAGLQTADNALWFATDEGISRYDGTTWQTFTTADGLPSDNVQTLAESGRILWAGTDKGLAFYEAGTWRVVTAGDIRALSRSTEGTLWFFNEVGLFYFDPTSGVLTAVATPPVSIVYDQLATAEGFWIATELGVYFLPGGRPSTTTEWQSLTPSNEAITALAQTADGRLWAATGQGLAELQDDHSWETHMLSALSDHMPITRLTADTDGSLLIGNYDGRVFRYLNGEILPVKDTPIGSEHSPISAIIATVAGELWVAHFGGGVSRRQAGPWQRFSSDDRLQNAAVNSLALTSDNIAKLGTDQGLLAITAEGDSMVCEFAAVGQDLGWRGVVVDWEEEVWGLNGSTFWQVEGEELTRAGVLALPVTAVAPDGAVWVATENGLVRHAGGRRQTVSTETIIGNLTALAIAPDNSIWVGTMEGVFWFDGQPEATSGRTWRHYTAADGLAANHVTHLAIAPDGTVWVATVGGVSEWLRP